MKICCKLPNTKSYPGSYTYLNLFTTLQKTLNFYKYDGNVERGTTHFLFLDFVRFKKKIPLKRLRRSLARYSVFQLFSKEKTSYQNRLSRDALSRIDFNTKEMSKFLGPLKNNGIKIIMCIYDPAGFSYLDPLIDYFDKIILFDQKFKNRFPVPTYISDYFVNEDLFSKPPETYENKVCYFGHLHQRQLPEGVVHIQADSLEELYRNIQKFNGAYVFDIGDDEKGRKGKIHHNKAKAIEILMCGRNLYAMPGIKTKAYDKFILLAEEYKNCHPILFDQKEISELNRKCIQHFIDEIINT